MRSSHVPAGLEASASPPASSSACSSSPVSTSVSSVLAVSAVGHPGEPAGLREGDPRPQHFESCGGPFERPERHPQVVVSTATSRPCPASVASVIASRKSSRPPRSPRWRGPSPVAEGAGRPGQAKLLGQGERLLGVAEPVSFRLAGHASDLGERADELRAGRQRLQQRQRLGGQLHARGSASRRSTMPERAHRPGGATNVACRLEGGDRLLQRVLRLASVRRAWAASPKRASAAARSGARPG